MKVVVCVGVGGGEWDVVVRWFVVEFEGDCC